MKTLAETENNQEPIKRPSVMSFNKHDFTQLLIADLSQTRDGRLFLKKYTQSEVRDIIEGYRFERNQIKLRDISQILYAKSGHYQRLLKYFAGMALFAHVITPVKDIRNANTKKVVKQYTEIGELLKMMNLRHEMFKALQVAFREDVFYGYIHRDKNSFYIQQLPPYICKITSIQDGVFNFSIDMSYFVRDEGKLYEHADEIQQKYWTWKTVTQTNPSISQWVELDPRNTICIKVNEDIIEVFPPFAPIFDAIFDIEAYKQLRKDKEELGNYMVVTQELPMRKDSENNNDFLIDKEVMMFFHNMVVENSPTNVGVITSPMKLDFIKFERDTPISDGVENAQRDFWSSSGTSQLLFNADKTTSQGLLMSIKTDEEIVFGLLTQIERWLNRYLKFEYGDNLMFNAEILHVTVFNRQEMFDMYLKGSQFGLPVKNHLCATIGLSPIETMNMAHLENDILQLHDKFIPLMSSHTMSDKLLLDNTGGSSTGGRPKKDPQQLTDEAARSQDKPNAN